MEVTQLNQWGVDVIVVAGDDFDVECYHERRVEGWQKVERDRLEEDYRRCAQVVIVDEVVADDMTRLKQSVDGAPESPVMLSSCIQLDDLDDKSMMLDATY